MKNVSLTNGSVEVLEDSGAMVQGHVELGLHKQITAQNQSYEVFIFRMWRQHRDVDETDEACLFVGVFTVSNVVLMIRRTMDVYPLRLVQVDLCVEQLVIIIVFVLPLLDDRAESRSEADKP